MKTLATLIVALTLFVPAAFSADKISFPGGPGQSIDPTKRYSVEWQGPFTVEDKTYKVYRLYLKNLSTGTQRELQTFDYTVDVYWAPNGNAVAINDWNGVNAADISIYFPDRPDDTINLQEALAASIKPLQYLKNKDVFYEVIGWRSNNTIHFKVWGRGEYNPSGFEKYFEYAFRTRVKEIRK